MISYERKFLFSLFLTIIIEIPIAIFLIKYLYKYKKIKIYKITFIGFIASALTLPYFWFILPVFIHTQFLYIFIGESLIILIESIIYNQLLNLKLQESFIISLVANLASIFLGLIIYV